MSTRKICGYGFLAVILALAFAALSLTGCEQPTTGGGGGGGGSITYTAVQEGGADGAANSTAIKFTFRESVSDLTANDITVTDGSGSVIKGALSDNGDSWSLAVTVVSAGDVTVSIAKTGIDARTKSVTVYKAGETVPTLSGITANYTGTTPIFPTTQLNSLKTNLTVTAQYSNGRSETLPDSAYTLSGTLDIGESDVTVSYTKDGVTKTTTFTVNVISSTLTYTVAQIGGEDGVANSTAIEFTFNAPVTNLTASNITVGGKAAKGTGSAALTGSGTTWTLAITVNGAGRATVSINRSGIETETKNVTVYSATEIVPRFTVTFNANGGTPAPQNQSVEEGGTVSEPEDMTKAGFLFDGWYKEAAFTTLWNFDTPVTGAITIYAKWLAAYTVTFNSNGGSAVDPQTVTEGGMATRPADPIKANAGFYTGTPPTFNGWKLNGTTYNFSAPVTSNITLTADWSTSAAGFSLIDLSSTSGDNIIAKAVSYIINNSSGTTEFTLVLDADVTNVGQDYKSGVTLTITSVEPIVISKGTADGYVFAVWGEGANSKLVIDGHVTLQGKNNNNDAVVKIGPQGTLELKGYAKITGNTHNTDNDDTFSIGGGVSASGGSIIMSGNAEISANKSDLGGGVFLSESASLTMNNNAAIKNNTAGSGGGVAIADACTFTMNGGEISGNTATYGGGGVIVYDGSQFIVASQQVKANIKNNNAGIEAWGLQVHKQDNGTFTVGGAPAVSF